MTNPIGVPTNSFAVASLVVSFFVPFFGLTLGLVAYDQIAVSGEAGRKLATAGIVVSIVHMVLAVLVAGFLLYGCLLYIGVWMLVGV
ncbi:hypothetical protein BH11ACT5_BH11ACT5_09440 [soil metagenome]